MALACQFSPQLQHNLGLVSFCPSSKYMAACVGSRCTIRDASSLEVVQIFACVDKIERAEFSPDSDYILCGMLDRAAAQVFCIADPEWKCRINEGIAGMINCRWCPDSRHILIESDYGIQLAVWSLIDGTSAIISYPKPTNIIAFSDDNAYCAIGLRIDLQDYIGFYSINGESQKVNPNETIKSNASAASAASSRKPSSVATKKAGLNVNSKSSTSIGSSLRNWEEISKFKCKSNDLSALHFIPNSHMIVAIDAAVQYKLIVYMPTGEVVMNYEAYTQALGIRTISMHKPPADSQASPTDRLAPYSSNSEELLSIENNHGSLLAIGSYDSNVRLISMRSWEMVQVLPSVHPRELGFAIDTDVDVHALKNDNYFVSMTVETIGMSANASSKSSGGFNGNDDFASDFESAVNNEGEGNTEESSSGPLASSVFMSNMDNKLSQLKAAAPGVHGPNGRNQAGTAFVQRNLKQIPKSFSTEGVRNTKGGGLPKMGVNWCCFDSTNHQLLGIHDETYPRWRPSLCQLSSAKALPEPKGTSADDESTDIDTGEGAHAVVSASASSNPPVLAMCTGTSRVYFWTPAGGGSGITSWADLPLLSNPGAGGMATTTGSGISIRSTTGSLTSTFGITSLKWSNDGVKLLLVGRDSHCTCEIDYAHCTPPANEK